MKYYKIYKPYMMLSQFSRESEKPTLADLGFEFEKDVYPVGRLDADSEGLLILTNDKSLNNKLLNPKHEHNRTYLVQVDGQITTEAIKELQKGVVLNIDGKSHKTAPAAVKAIEEPQWLPPRNPPIRYRKNIPTSWIELTIQEGKNRQVKKMTAKVGFPTLRLVRWKMEDMSIENMLSGDIVELERAEVQKQLKLG